MVARRLALVAALALAAPAAAEQVGEIGTDWTGNDIVIGAIADPKVKGITCHMTYFSRGMIDRLRQCNWFEDPSNSSIACRQITYARPETLIEAVSGAPAIKTATLSVTVDYDTDAPLAWTLGVKPEGRPFIPHRGDSDGASLWFKREPAHGACGVLRHGSPHERRRACVRSRP